MPRYIIKISDSLTNKNYYLEWSTIVDAPVTYGMSLEEFNQYYREEYGRRGMEELAKRLVRVDKNGTSGHPPFDNLAELLRTYDLNRPKVGNQKEFILNNFCRQKIG